MATTVKVKDGDQKTLRFTLVKGTLPLLSLQAYFEGASGLSYSEEGEEIVLPRVEDTIRCQFHEVKKSENSPKNFILR